MNKASLTEWCEKHNYKALEYGDGQIVLDGKVNWHHFINDPNGYERRRLAILKILETEE
jgi:hypothetical protein